MAVDADKIDNGLTKGKVYTWKGNLWAPESMGEPSDTFPVADEAGGEKVDGDGTGGDGRDDDTPRPRAG